MNKEAKHTAGEITKDYLLESAHDLILESKKQVDNSSDLLIEARPYIDGFIKIHQLTEQTPNDTELGAKVRKLIND